jgi:hypothetical protein
MPEHPENQTIQPINAAQISLFAHFAPLTDPRINRRKEHDMIDILVISICPGLCGAQNFNDMERFGQDKRDWLKTFLTLRGGIPSHDTFDRLFAALDLLKATQCRS